MKKLLISAQIFLVSILGNVWRVGLLMCVCIKGLQYFIAKYFQNYFARKKQ